MKLAPAHKEIIFRYLAKFPVPRAASASPADESIAEEQCRQWTHRLAEQLAFSFPVEGFGHKSAGPGRPHSSDVFCIREPFLGWDIILGAGGTDPVINLDGDSIDLSGQIFEPVNPFNHISAPEPDPKPDPKPDPQPQPDALADKLDAILAELKAQRAAVESAVADIKKLQAFAPALIESITKGIKIRF